MRQSYQGKSVCVVDNGLFVELAVTLSEHFGKTWYYSPWEGGFPTSNQMLPGKGIPGIERANDYWAVAPEVDLWVFPDVYFAGLQTHLEELGKRVWGSRYGEWLELDRAKSKTRLKRLGASIGPWAKVTGMAALRAYLKTHEDQWVKISKTRGDMESFHAENYALIETLLDEKEHLLGAKKGLQEFIVEADIPDAVEIAYDGYAVDGRYPTCAMVGIEVKDRGYLGVFQQAEKMPESVRALNTLIAPTLRAHRYRNFMSLELLITRDGTGYVTDPCMRMGSPPGELQGLMYENLPDILWYGAEGECIEPEPAGKWGAELIIWSDWADKHWLPVQFPARLRKYVKLKELTVIDGEHYVVPQDEEMSAIGAVVAVGDTMDDAIATVQKYAQEIEGYKVEIFPDALEKGKEQVEKLRSFGIEL